MPRSRSSSPSGTRKRRKRSHSLPLTQWYLCECSECEKHPDVHPETKQVLKGCWVTEKDLRDHSANETALVIGRLMLRKHLLFPEEKREVRGTVAMDATDVAASLVTETSSIPPFDIPNSSYQSPHLQDARAPGQFGQAENEVKVLSGLIRPAESVLQDISVAFRSPPSRTAQIDPQLLSTEEIDQLCALDQSSRINTTVIGYQDVLSRARHFLNQHSEHELSRPDHSPNDRSIFLRLQLKLLDQKVKKEEERLRQLLLDQWQVQDQIAKLSFSYDTAHHHLKPFLSLSPVSLGCFLLVAILYLVSGLSIDNCTFLLGSLQTILRLAFRHSSDLQASFALRSIPDNVRSVIDILGVKTHFDSYVCCPSCSKLYWVDPDDPQYPDKCTNVEVDQAVCGAKLKKKQTRLSNSYSTPVRQYRHQSMKEYLARLYSRPDLESYLYRDPMQTPSGSDTWDIWQAPVLRDIIGPDGETPFIKAPEGEGRLVFSLNMDGFNPYGNKQAGKKLSVGGIYMVCLNLPPSIRYDIENVYLVGIIPGPGQPTAHEMNYLLKPLVDDLIDLWHDGIFLTRTSKYARGYRVRCALGPLVCDLPAARQMSGFPHFASTNFCSYCKLPLQNIQNLDFNTWLPRDGLEHIQKAWAWRNATTLQERERLVLEDGARWSELLRLAYWDPVKFTVIDSMHAFFLRLFQHHCRSIWGMDIAFEDGDGILFDSAKQPSEVEMMTARNLLQHGQKSQLLSLSVAILRELCRSISLDSKGLKSDLLKRLEEYRIRQGWFNASGQRLETQSQTFLLNQELQGTPDVIFAKNTIKTIEDVEDCYRNASKSTMTKLHKRDLLSLYLHCVQPNLQLPANELKRLPNPAILSYIQDARRKDGIVDEEGRHISTSRVRTRVLGKGIISEIKKDMAKTSLPSWVPPAPGHPGEKKWGKFSADQWRIFCTQVLPITLIRLWGHMEETSVERRRLDNFLHLVSAVKLATKRKMTESRIADYKIEMHKYLISLVELYPDVKITPYQHLALHFGDQLQRFGPTHAWRCFPFERYNYVMQNIPTNQKFGDLEKTMFDRFTSAQNVRILLKHGNIPQILDPLSRLFTKVFEADIRGTYRNDVMSHDEDFRKVSETVTWTDDQLASIPPDIYRLLRQLLFERYSIPEDVPVSRNAYFRQSISRLGQTFTIKQTSTSDSRVIYIDARNGSWSAASITSIFSHAYDKVDGSKVVATYAVIKEYKGLSSHKAAKDAFRRYPFSGGRLFQHAYQKEPILVEFSQITAHFAGYPYREPSADAREWLLALPLERS